MHCTWALHLGPVWGSCAHRPGSRGLHSGEHQAWPPWQLCPRGALSAVAGVGGVRAGVLQGTPVPLEGDSTHLPH